MITEWLLLKLESVKDKCRILVKDSLRLLPETDGNLHRFATENNFTVIVASTNLVFRELYENALSDTDITKILVVDRAPIRRKIRASHTKAPPPFYPDFLAETEDESRFDLDLRQFLKEKTGDPYWPEAVNDPQFSRLIIAKLENIFRAHENLRSIDKRRFTDNDLKTIIAFALLNIPESAFKRLDSSDYWKIGLLGHGSLQQLTDLTPEITKPILEELKKAQAPFCWFADHDAETVVRVFYLSVILSQHIKPWHLLLANIDPGFGVFNKIDTEIITEAAEKLIELDPLKADNDIFNIEQSLTRDAIHLIMLDQIKIMNPANYFKIIQNENYSVLIRSLALLFALKDMLSPTASDAIHKPISQILFSDTEQSPRFINTRKSEAWKNLKDAYGLSSKLKPILKQLDEALRYVKVAETKKLTFKYFWNTWNKKNLNRIEYYLSILERLIYSGNFLPRDGKDLPSIFENTLNDIKTSIHSICNQVADKIDDINKAFQKTVERRYPFWVKNDTEVILTSRFLERCLKPYWDPHNEKAVLFIFDGMRYEIWDELLKPMLEDRVDIIKEYQGSSLLPTETHITRKAISAGTFADSFNQSSGENELLAKSLKRLFSLKDPVDVINPEGMGTGETVRYRSGNLDVYIFELCDSELHHRNIKTLPDGRKVPDRPLSIIYQQIIKNIIDTEVMAIIRKIDPGTKLFVTADHGFTRVHREALWLDEDWLNDPRDCSYLNAYLRYPLSMLHVPGKVRNNVIEISIKDLRMPIKDTRFNKNRSQSIKKEYASIIFPKTGYSLKRPKPYHYNPDAYSHGGISLQEMMVPMVVMQVKSGEEGIFSLSRIEGPSEILEGEQAEYRMHISCLGKSIDKDIRITVEGHWGSGMNQKVLDPHILYISEKGINISYKIKPEPEDLSDEERKSEKIERNLTMSIHYKLNGKSFRKSQTIRFNIRINPERLQRRGISSRLGNILGLKPKTMR
ncbi:MAG: PglZ domain-containing protein [Spirochaetales bacterium]|nr:PglZ domain-containing protein [Spirochaetales bacterium]